MRLRNSARIRKERNLHKTDRIKSASEKTHIKRSAKGVYTEHKGNEGAERSDTEKKVKKRNEEKGDCEGI